MRRPGRAGRPSMSPRCGRVPPGGCRRGVCLERRKHHVQTCFRARRPASIRRGMGQRPMFRSYRATCPGYGPWRLTRLSRAPGAMPGDRQAVHGLIARVGVRRVGAVPGKAVATVRVLENGCLPVSISACGLLQGCCPDLSCRRSVRSNINSRACVSRACVNDCASSLPPAHVALAGYAIVGHRWSISLAAAETDESQKERRAKRPEGLRSFCESSGYCRCTRAHEGVHCVSSEWALGPRPFLASGAKRAARLVLAFACTVQMISI